MTVYWVCMASIWKVPGEECDARGEGVTPPEKHTKATGHPTTTTLSASFADRLAQRRL